MSAPPSFGGSIGPTILGQGAFIPVSGSFGDAVRGFTAAELLLQRLVKQRPADGEESAAEAIWGKPSNFQVADINELGTVNEGTVVVWPDDQGTFVTPITTINFEETERTVTTVRVENPDDSDQYVMVKRVETITFKGPDLRPKELLTGYNTYPNTLAGSLQRISDSFARAVGGQVTSQGQPQATRPPYAFYKLNLKNDGSTEVPP